MARTKMPSKLAKEGSAKHFTKAELAEREAEEVAMSCEDIKPSEFLPDLLHKRFFWIVEQFKEYGILSNVDGDALSMYLIAVDGYRKATIELRKMGVANKKYLPVLKVQKEYFSQATILAKELGLTMVSRSKLKRKEEDKKEPLTEEQILFGGDL